MPRRTRAAAGALAVFFILWTTVLLWMGASGMRAALTAGWSVAALAAAEVVAQRRIMSPVFGGPAESWVMAAIWGIGLGGFATGGLPAVTGLSNRVAVTVGVVIAAVSILVYRWTTTKTVDETTVFGAEKQPRSSAEAKTMVAAARRAVSRHDLRGSRRVVAQRNLAQALMWQSILDRQPGLLREGRSIIDHLGSDPAASREDRLSAAVSLFSSVNAYAAQTGDGSEFPAAMRIYADLAGDDPNDLPLVHEQRSDYAGFRAYAEGPTNMRAAVALFEHAVARK